MTGEQLKALRDGRSMTREQLAAELGDCSPSTINKWERNINPVPEWVAEKMLSSVRISFPLTDLHELLDLAREEGISFEDLLSQAIQDLIEVRRSRPKAQAPYPVKTGAVSYPRPFDDPALKVAEDAPPVVPPTKTRKAS